MDRPWTSVDRGTFIDPTSAQVACSLSSCRAGSKRIGARAPVAATAGTPGGLTEHEVRASNLVERSRSVRRTLRAGACGWAAGYAPPRDRRTARQRTSSPPIGRSPPVSYDQVCAAAVVGLRSQRIEEYWYSTSEWCVVLITVAENRRGSSSPKSTCRSPVPFRWNTRARSAD